MDPSFLISGFMILLFVAMIPLSIVFSLKRKAKILEAGRALGEALGLELVDGQEAFRRARLGADDEALAQFDKLPPLLRNLLARGGSWSLRGERGGLRVAIYPETRSSGRNSTTYTVVRAYLREPLGFELRVRREGVAAKLGKALFKLQDIEIGDEVLDPLIRIKAGDPDRARLVLGRAEARRALAALAASGLDFTVLSDCVHWEQLGTRLDPAEIGPVLELLIPAATAIFG